MRPRPTLKGRASHHPVISVLLLRALPKPLGNHPDWAPFFDTEKPVYGLGVSCVFDLGYKKVLHLIIIVSLSNIKVLLWVPIY